jgi:hypothetical protein
MQSAEATDFLIRPRTFDANFPLVLWQFAAIGQRGFSKGKPDPKGLLILRDYLAKFYPSDHEVIIYLAATLSVIEPTIQRIPLSALPNTSFHPAATLYVPPLKSPEYDVEMLAALGMQPQQEKVPV